MINALSPQSNTDLVVMGPPTSLPDTGERLSSPRAALSRDLARGIFSGATRRGVRHVLRNDRSSHERWQGVVREPGTCPHVVLAVLQESITAYRHLETAYSTLAENFRPTTAQVDLMSQVFDDYRTATSQTHEMLLEREAWLLNYALTFPDPAACALVGNSLSVRRHARLQRQLRRSREEQLRSRPAYTIWNSIAALDAALVAVEELSASVPGQEDWA